MISPDKRAEIRRLYYAEHWKIGTIATELSVHRDTVKYAVECERFRPRQTRPRDSQLDPFKPLIEQTLEAHPRLTSMRLFEMIRARGYSGSDVTVRRFVRTVRPTRGVEAYFRLETLAGEQAQVDWAHFGSMQIGKARRALSCFVMVLSYSRAMYARFALDQTLESFLRAHIEAFEALGGVPRTLLYDNLKSVVLDRVGDHIHYQPRLLEFAGHYHFVPKPCAPYRGNEKGKVERSIQYLRSSFFAARSYDSLADLNAQLTDWIDRVAHARHVPAHPDRRLVRDALLEERSRLLPLPEHPFECDVVRALASGKTPYLRFDLNDYSIPHILVRRPLTLVASEKLVRVLDGSNEVARHARSYDRAQRVEDPAHLDALATQKQHVHEMRSRDRLKLACTQIEPLLDAIAARGQSLTPHTRRLRVLLEQYGPTELDQAIAEVLARGTPSADSVAHWLDQIARARHQKPHVPITLPNDPRVRNLRVTPHALSPYDALSTPPNGDPK